MRLINPFLLAVEFADYADNLPEPALVERDQAAVRAFRPGHRGRTEARSVDLSLLFLLPLSITLFTL